MTAVYCEDGSDLQRLAHGVSPTPKKTVPAVSHVSESRLYRLIGSVCPIKSCQVIELFFEDLNGIREGRSISVKLLKRSL